MGFGDGRRDWYFKKRVGVGIGLVSGAECLMGMLNKGTARSMAGCGFG